MKRKHERKRKNRAVLILLVLAALLAAAALALLIGYHWMEARGRMTLAQRQLALPEAMEQARAAADDGEEEPEEVLEAGEVRYQGKTYAYKKEILTFLFMGIDKKGEQRTEEDQLKGGQSDALFLVVLDPEEEKISVVGVNRDTMTQIAVYDEDGLYIGTKTAQIALQHGYGDGMELSCERTVDAVSHLFYGIPIHGYCSLRMDVIALVNDAVGGVDVTVPEDVTISGALKWRAGEQVHLEGEDAYAFVQNRDIHAAGSAQERLDRQKLYLQAFIQKAEQAVSQDISLIPRLYAQVAPYMVTDLTAEEVVYLASQALGYRFSGEDMYTMEGEVEQGDPYEEFYQDDTALYELILALFYQER